MKRREALIRLGAGTAGMVLGARGMMASPELKPETLADLAERIRRTPRAEIFDLAGKAIRSGADPNALLGATFVAGVHDVRPRPVGGNLHSVMVVEAAFRLVERAASPEEAWLVALWTLDAFKGTQKEEHGDQWVLPPAGRVEFATEAAARAELIAALDSWDEARADRAIIGLLPFHDRESLYEVLWPYTGRCMAYLGHKVVYGAMTEAVLRRIDWKHAEPTARSLVYGLVGSGQGTRAHKGAMSLVDSIPDGWLVGKENPPQSEAILRKLLSGSYREAQQTVVAALADGLGPQTVWDAIRLGAAELFMRRKSNNPRSGEAIRAVHAVTEMWCMGHTWRTTKSERTRRLVILQASGWVPELRDALVERDAISMKGPGIVALGDGVEDSSAGLGAIVEAGEPGAARLYFDRRPEMARTYLEGLRQQVAPKGVEYHQFKYAVAVEDESRLADPRWSSRLLAAGMGYMPTATDSNPELTHRAMSALRKAGAL